MVDRHLQYVINVFILELHFQRIGFEAFAVARFTLQHQVGHELHLHCDGSVAFALFAASALVVKAKIACRIAHLLGQWLICPELTDFVVCFDVGYRIRTGGLTDGVLIDKLHVAQVAQVASDGCKLTRAFSAFIQFTLQRPVEDVTYQCALSRSADPCYDGHHIEREAYVYSFQVVFAGTFYLDIVVPRAAVFRYGNVFLAQQVFHSVTVAAFL